MLRIGVAVEEHGEVELVGRPGPRRRARRRPPQREPVPSSATKGTTSSAPKRGCTPACVGEVDAFGDRAREPSHRLLGVACTGTGEGEHRPVMVGIGVHVEQ